MLLSTTVNKFQRIFSIFLIKLSIFLKFFLIFSADTFEILILLLIFFCTFFFFYSLFQAYIILAKILDHLHRYENSKTLLMFQHLFSRTDVFLLFIIFLTFLTSLIITMFKSKERHSSHSH